MIRLIVGLGNPGSEYDDTRHNAGFWWVDAAARKLGATLQRDRAYHGLVARINRKQVDSAAPSNLNPAGGGTSAARPWGRSEEPLWLLEPQTYMNLSGKSVAALARFFKIAPQEILVVHDELDLPPGQAKLKQGGGAAGHNGLKDILAQLGSPDFWRLRIGVGHPGVKSEVVDWVLRKPPPEHRDAMQLCIARTLEALPLLIDGAMERAMMKIHPKPAAKPTATEP